MINTAFLNVALIIFVLLGIYDAISGNTVWFQMDAPLMVALLVFRLSVSDNIKERTDADTRDK